MVVASGFGETDLTGLTLQVSGQLGPVLLPNEGVIITGPVLGGVIDGYSGFTGPPGFGSAGFASALGGGGDLVGINGGGNPTLLFVPQGYVSGSFLSAFSFYGLNANFKGITPGTYEWTWGPGPDQNFTLKVGTVPDQGTSLALLAIGVVCWVGFSFVQRRAM